MSATDWTDLGAIATPPVRPRDGQPGTAAWLMRSPDDSQDGWAITATHRPGIEHDGTTYGPDAWRVLVQIPAELPAIGWEKSFDLVVESEGEALDVVRWLLASAEDGGAS